MKHDWTPSLHPRNPLGEFSPFHGGGGNAKRLKKIQKSKAKLQAAQTAYVRTAYVKTALGGRRPLNKTEARRLLKDANVQMNRVQGHKLARRSAAAKVQQAQAAHLALFGRKPKPVVKRKGAGRRMK